MTFAPRPLSFYAGQKHFVLKTHKTQPPTLKKAKISLCKDVTPYHKNRKIKNSKKNLKLEKYQKKKLKKFLKKVVSATKKTLKTKKCSR